MIDNKTLKELTDRVLDNLELVIDKFQVDLADTGDSWSGHCPIHSGADNTSAFQIFKNTGYWQCRTHSCHETFRPTAIGFIRALLSKHNLGWSCSLDSERVFGFKNTIEELDNLLAGAPVNVRKKEKIVFRKNAPTLSIEKFTNRVEIPSKFYLSRGYGETVLNKFLVGDLREKYSPMNDRAIVPVLSEDGSHIIGLTGRSLAPKCCVCDGFHQDYELCPDDTQRDKFQKWKNSRGFARNSCLYNYWNAKEHILRTKKAILVEGPSDVWKLEECGIRNSLAIFGATLTAPQASLLTQLCPRLITTIMDNDEGGDAAEASVLDKMNACVDKWQFWKTPTNDLGDMTTQEIRLWIKAQIKR